MSEDTKGLIAALNSSGFPFQVGVRQEIERTSHEHGWQVEVEEHRWDHPGLGESGYIDLVISHSPYIFTILIECKRMRAGELIFLTPEGSSDEVSRLSAFFTYRAANTGKDVYWWADAPFCPVSPEAAYCVMKNQDEKSPMLERIADGLLPAVESVGLEHLSLKAKDRLLGEHRLFLPIVVTNAKLFRVKFDPKSVSLESGLLGADDCVFESVPSIRFRKSLSTHYPSYQTHVLSGSRGESSLSQAGLGNERGMLVVNSLALSGTLKQFVTRRSDDIQFGFDMFRMSSVMGGD